MRYTLDAAGRFLPAYANNTVAGHKSYHVVGELNDFFGGYYRDDDYGFGHWSRYEEMPGQKLWLWALSRQGGIWEDLLTDTDGPYIEFQAGRLLVQYQPGAAVGPIRQDGFDPGSADRWSETWFPLEGIGGLTDASSDGAMYVEHEDGKLTIRANAFVAAVDTLRVSSGDHFAVSIPLTLPVLEPVERIIDLPSGSGYRVELPALGLSYASDSAEREIRRPFSTDLAARAEIPEMDRRVFQARELSRGRNLRAARETLESVLVEEPWNRDALLGLADLEYRRARFEAGLAHVDRALQLDAYDAGVNFTAGNLHRALGDATSAIEAYGWAARSMAFRSVSYVQLAELMLVGADRVEAERYARLAIDYDRYSLPARQVLALVARERADTVLAEEIRSGLLEIDPLHHFAAAEAYLAEPTPTSAEMLLDGLRGEYPEQVLLELAIDYLRRGAIPDARAVVELAQRRSANPLLRAWGAWLADDPSALPDEIELAFAFPFRRETIPVLEWALEQTDGWSWRYLLGLNLWARDREGEAAAHLTALGDQSDFAPAYVTRGLLLAQTDGRDPEADLRRAVELGSDIRILHIHLVRHLRSRERWEEALEASATARRRFPEDFDLDLLHVGSLNHLGRVGEAIEILDSTHVLPSENSGESHRLHERAH